MQWNKKSQMKQTVLYVFFYIIVVIYYLYKSIYYKSQLFK